jgi:hypothetical protein
LQERHCQVDRAQPEQEIEILIPDRAVDDPPLQLQRHHGQRKDQRRQQAEPRLMPPALAPGEGEHVAASRRG